jgi:hypothetical protein
MGVHAAERPHGDFHRESQKLLLTFAVGNLK